MERVDVVVVGAGVVGLAVARAFARVGREVLLLERESAIGTGVSSRNSEVIHAGLYYPPGSLKARLCVAGRDLLYGYCAEYGVPFRRCGKLVVATDRTQLAELGGILARALANGVADARLIDADEAKALEPEVRSVGALLSPSTGIVDSHALMVSLLGGFEAAGGTLALATPVVAGRLESDGVVLVTAGASSVELGARLVVNAASLGAQALARAIEGHDPASVPPLHLAKGTYFHLAGRAPFRHLVYPVPILGGLGVHATLDLGGRVRFGPDVEWVDTIDYAPDPARGASFYASIRDYWPGLPDDALVPGYCGIRPKIARPGGSATDFLIEPPTRGAAGGLVNLFGIESPGLTSCLAIAEQVLRLAA
jgi:L-2-hydroxyglutarate oxidase LhgO